MSQREKEEIESSDSEEDW